MPDGYERLGAQDKTFLDLERPNEPQHIAAITVFEAGRLARPDGGVEIERVRAYVESRREGEAIVRSTGIPATLMRPWYVLGPGHRWPYALLPLYALLRRIPATREGANRLGLVTRPEMVAALVRAVSSPPSSGVRVVEVPEIRGLEAPAANP